MKGPSCAFVASVVAASTAALSSSSSSDSLDGNAAFHAPPNPNDRHDSSLRRKISGATDPSSDKDKFAPRFDGLRFIETLVTAHR